MRLPDLIDEPTKAKIDTGARTSALHAFNVQRFRRDDIDMVRFDIHPRQRSRAGSVTIERPVVDVRRVRSSTGHTEHRPVIRTPIEIGDRRFEVEITLTARDSMGFRMLIGRSALRRGRFLVNPARSFTDARDTAERLLARLQGLGLVREITGGTRFRLWTAVL